MVIPITLEVSTDSINLNSSTLVKALKIQPTSLSQSGRLFRLNKLIPITSNRLQFRRYYFTFLSQNVCQINFHFHFMSDISSKGRKKLHILSLYEILAMGNITKIRDL